MITNDILSLLKRSLEEAKASALSLPNNLTTDLEKGISELENNAKQNFNEFGVPNENIREVSDKIREIVKNFFLSIRSNNREICEIHAIGSVFCQTVICSVSEEVLTLAMKKRKGMIK